MRAKVKSKIIPTSALKIEGKERFVGAKEEWLVEFVGDQNPVPKAPPRSKRGREMREQRKCQKSDCQKSNEEE